MMVIIVVKSVGMNYILKNSRRKFQFKMEMPIECENCGEKFDLKPSLKEGDMKKNINKVLKEKFGDKVLCEDCR